MQSIFYKPPKPRKIVLTKGEFLALFSFVGFIGFFVGQAIAR